MTPKECTVPEPQSVCDAVTSAIDWVDHTQKCVFSQRLSANCLYGWALGSGLLMVVFFLSPCLGKGVKEETRGDKEGRRKGKDGVGRRPHISYEFHLGDLIA